MTDLKSIFNENFSEKITKITKDGIENAARGSSGMIGKPIVVKKSSTKIVKLMDISKMLGGPEEETVAIYLKAEGSLEGQMMLSLPFDRAMSLVDLIMGEPIGTTTSLGQIEKSALQELGNITGTFFLNTIADQTGISTRPSPPAVIVDMVAAILDIIIATAGGEQEDVLLIEAEFDQEEVVAPIQFWVIPNSSVIQFFEKK